MYEMQGPHWPNLPQATDFSAAHVKPSLTTNSAWPTQIAGFPELALTLKVALSDRPQIKW